MGGVDSSSSAVALGGDVDATIQFIRNLCQAMGLQAAHADNAWALAKVRYWVTPC